MLGFRDRSAEAWLRDKSASLLDKLKGRWRGNVQNAIASGLKQGQNPRSVGLELAGRVNSRTGRREGGLVDLDEGEKRTVAGFRRCLVEFDQDYFGYELRDKRYDRSVRRSISEQAPIESEKIDLLVNRFEAKLLKHKADLIAQTEMLATMNRSAWIQFKEAMIRSERPAAAVARVWDSCGDDKVRPSHKALEGQRVVGFDESFVSPLTGAKMMYPGDRSLGAPEEEVLGCRCRVRYDVNFFRRVK